MTIHTNSGLKLYMQSAIAAAATISAITKAAPGVLNSTGHTFVNGDVLVDPKDKDGKPVAIEMALEPSIPGLKEGLQLTGVGGKLKLYVPAELGYGDKGMFPGALTIFEVEILEVKEPTKQPEEKK